jgi:predicted ribosome quality control (RQC) complex YloA/Tae2 family protein
MGSRQTIVTTRKHIERRIKTLHDTLETILAEARALRRHLELLAEARQMALEKLRPARRSARTLDLRHANRVF